LHHFCPGFKKTPHLSFIAHGWQRFGHARFKDGFSAASGSGHAAVVFGEGCRRSAAQAVTKGILQRGGQS
jgi:hypothetical protein